MVQSIKKDRRELERKLADALRLDADSLSSVANMLSTLDSSKSIVNECMYLSFLVERASRNITRWSDESEGVQELPFPGNSW